MRVKLALFSIIVASLILSGYANATSVAPDQTKPDLVLKIRNLSSAGRVLKGNTSELPFELLAAEARGQSTKLVLRGNPALTYINNTSVNAEGTLNGTRLQKDRWFRTFIQNDSYVPDVPVDKRFTRKGGDSDLKVFQIDVNRTYNSKYTFDELDAIDNVTKRTGKNGAVTAFIFRTGYLSSVDLNETEGTIFKFQVRLRIAFFVTTTKKLIGVYDSTDRGFGNIIPKGVVEYFKTHKFPYRGEEKAKGRDLLANRTKIKINWISLGYNETYGLDMYLGMFRFTRVETALIWDPTAASSIKMLALDDASEDFMDGMVSDNSFSDFDVDNIDTIDQEIVDDVSEDSGIDLNNIASDTATDTTGGTTSETTEDEQSTVDNKAIFIGQSLALLAIGVIALRRVKKNL